MSDRRDNGKRIMEAIREVLVRDWDPIGVMDDPEWPRDEYDSYIGEIYRYLARDEPADFMARHLCLIEETQIGCGRMKESLLMPVAIKLKAIDVSPRVLDSASGPADEA